MDKNIINIFYINLKGISLIKIRRRTLLKVYKRQYVNPNLIPLALSHWCFTERKTQTKIQPSYKCLVCCDRSRVALASHFWMQHACKRSSSYHHIILVPSPNNKKKSTTTITKSETLDLTAKWRPSQSR